MTSPGGLGTTSGVVGWAASGKSGVVGGRSGAGDADRPTVWFDDVNPSSPAFCNNADPIHELPRLNP